MPSPPPPLPPPSALPARDRIVQAAQLLFYRHGIRGTGVERIIDEAGVTKVTFYRHFPAKDDLVRVYLERRHEAWTRWFVESLAASRGRQTEDSHRKAPLTPVLDAARIWFATAGFRGCAFANMIAESSATDTVVLGIAAQHKHEVRDVIASLLPGGGDAATIAWAATLALDGAAVNAQLGRASVEASLDGLRTLLDALTEHYASLNAARLR